MIIVESAVSSGTDYILSGIPVSRTPDPRTSDCSYSTCFWQWSFSTAMLSIVVTPSSHEARHGITISLRDVGSLTTLALRLS